MWAHCGLTALLSYQRLRRFLPDDPDVAGDLEGPRSLRRGPNALARIKGEGLRNSSTAEFAGMETSSYSSSVPDFFVGRPAAAPGTLRGRRCSRALSGRSRPCRATVSTRARQCFVQVAFACMALLWAGGVRLDARPAGGREQTALARPGGAALSHAAEGWVLQPLVALRVSSQTPPWLRELVSQARDEWASADPRLFVPVVETLPGLENIHYQPTTDPTHVGETNLRSDGGPTIVIWPRHEDAYSVVLHELGHALCGCGLHLAEGVMRPKSNVTRQLVTRVETDLVVAKRMEYYSKNRPGGRSRVGSLLRASR
jgi:hypothetical protein